MADDFRILLLGPPAIYYRGESFSFSRRGLRSLLYYLACQRSPISRSELALLFWEEAPDRDARLNLRVSLSRLRGELPDPEMLAIDQEQVQLIPHSCYCDALLFEELYEETARACAQIPSATPLPEGVRQRMLQALELWRGPRFLGGADLGGSADLDTWLIGTADRLDGCRQRLLERLADHGVAVGDLEASVKRLQEILAINPTSDPIHQRLVELIERQGRINEALIHLQKAQNAYIEDGFEGLPSGLRATQERLRRASRAPADNRPDRLGRRTLQIPWVERQSAWESLQGAVFSTQPVFVLGEAGAGKSRLIQEFLAASTRPQRVLTAAARPLSSSSPFQQIIELLRGQVTPEEWRAIPPIWLNAVALLLPEIETLVPGTLKPSGTALTQSLLLESLYQVFLRLASGKLLVLVLDDAQWGDDTSFAALNYLLEKGFFREQASLILAARVEDQQPAFATFFQHTQASQACRVIHLAPLEAGEIGEFAHYVFPRAASPDWIERLRQETGGNPLFLLETLRALLEIGPDGLDGSPEQLPLADSIYGLARDRLQRLSGEAQNILTYAAVIGSNFSLELLERASRLSPEQVAAGLDELEGAHLVRVHPECTHPGSYSFIHAKLREVVLLEVSSARRRFYFLRVAEALKELPGGVDNSQLAALAGLYEEAGEDIQAFDYWLSAAKYARQLFSNTEALRAYHSAEKILQRADRRIADAGVVQLYTNWVGLSFNMANAQELRQAAVEMEKAGWRRQNLILITGSFLGMAGAADLADEPGEGLQILEQVRPLLQQRADATARESWLMFYFFRGGFLSVLSRFGEAVVELEQALQMARELNSPNHYELLANVGYRLAGAYLYHGYPQKAVQLADQAFDESRAGMSHAGAARAVVTLSTANFYLGRYAPAKEYAEFGLRMLQPMQNLRLLSALQINIAQTEGALGNLDLAWTTAGQALETGLAHGFKRVQTQAYRVRGDVLRVLGDLNGAGELYRESIAVQPQTYVTMESLARLGLVMVQLGELEEGLEMIRRTVDFCRKSGISLFQIMAEANLATALAQLGRRQEAIELAEDLAVRASEQSLPSVRGTAYRLLAQAALEDGRPDEARQKALVMARQGRELPSPFLEVMGLSLTLAAEQKMGYAPAQPASRLREVLALLEAGARLPELRPAYEAYARGIQAYLH